MNSAKAEKSAELWRSAEVGLMTMRPILFSQPCISLSANHTTVAPKAGTLLTSVYFLRQPYPLSGGVHVPHIFLCKITLNAFQ